MTWHSVSEQKPPEGKAVLLYDEAQQTFRVGAWDQSFQTFDMYGCNPDYCEPTHWQRLQPPVLDTDDEDLVDHRASL